MVVKRRGPVDYSIPPTHRHSDLLAKSHGGQLRCLRYEGPMRHDQSIAINAQNCELHRASVSLRSSILPHIHFSVPLCAFRLEYHIGANGAGHNGLLQAIHLVHWWVKIQLVVQLTEGLLLLQEVETTRAILVRTRCCAPISGTERRSSFQTPLLMARATSY